MRVVVTRPHADSERTAAALERLGHEALVAPLMRIEPVDADLAGRWSSIAITSANAPAAIAGHAGGVALTRLPVFAVGARSAEAAKHAGFADVSSANGDVNDLVRLIAARCAGAKTPLLYLAGEDRAADLVAELSARGVVAEMRVVYRAVPVPFPTVLAAALEAGDVDAVLHFSRRSAELFVSGARAAGVAGPALDVRHLCLSAQVAEALAGAGRVAIAARPDEAALINLLQA
ncbi:MAG TPA: uroporphyrinogen-III synthase [Pseudolabrys sp.]|nr:uroporphyrinogen-III synthase [Pseudolabrys sp.]